MTNSGSFLRRILFAFLSSGCVLALSSSVARAQRLPTNAVPQRYTLKLTPDVKTAKFTGVETIAVSLKQPARSITLNAAEIDFQSVELTAAGKSQKATVSLDKEKQQATFAFPNQIPAGKAMLSIHYTGILNNELRGFYLSKNAGHDYAVTQFEPTDARRAFPGFDEPAFKAVFDVTVVAPKGDMVISNSPVQSDIPGPEAGEHTVKFYPTPRMSTYLVAFLVGDFKCASGQADDVPIRVCSTPDKVNLTLFALKTAEFALHYYDNYFGIHYPLKKLDLIGLPDFEAGAMENFGAITFRETALLVDAKTASIGARQQVAVDIAHEMAHQWFGDLVTMQWWNNIWLNEGFATWMENKPVAAMHPEWKMPQVVASSEQNALNYDATATTHPIRARVASTPAEINQLFDTISYYKASDVLLMVENYLGPEMFRKGIHAYLEAHAYGNATAQDFWNAQTATSHKPVNTIMESLVTEPGEPMLTFGSPQNGEVSVRQQRFFLNPDVKPDPKEQWTIPVCFKTGSSAGGSQSVENEGNQHCELLSPGVTSLKVPAASLFYANAGAKGYYRSSYPEPVYKELVARAETQLSPSERIGLTGDEWARVRSNRATVGDYLDLVLALKSDPNAVVFSNAVAGVKTIKERLAATPEQREEIAAWIRHTFSPEYAKLGALSPSDSPDKRQLRAALFGLLGYYGKDQAVIAQAKQITERYLEHPEEIDPTLGQTAMSVAASIGNAALFDKLQQIYETSTNPVFQNNALRMLAEFEDPALEQRALEFAVSGKVRSQDAAIQLAIALQIPAEREQAWKFIQSHWQQVKAGLPTEMGEILVSSSGSFCTAEARDQVQDFFSTHQVNASSMSLQHAVEAINGCIELRQAQGSNLESWLNHQPGLQLGN
jgi:aminopeptidase N/puromycin-sensitive aminopeptidase